MMYSEAEARKLVIEAGIRLVENKLIARTWGNISARISDTEFIITPSGRAYENLRCEDLVKVKIEDCSYEGDIKPSSEKGIHAAAYAIRSDCNFIIHTHQLYASAICAEGRDTSFAPCAKYGISGSKGLMKKVAHAIKKNPDKNMFLMTKHGAVCLGKSYDDAFSLAKELEVKCKELFDEKWHTPTDGIWLDDYAQMFDLNGSPNPGEDEEAIRLVREKNTAAAKYVTKAKPIPAPLAFIEHFVYTTKYSKQKDQK